MQILIAALHPCADEDHHARLSVAAARQSKWDRWRLSHIESLIPDQLQFSAPGELSDQWLQGLKHLPSGLRTRNTAQISSPTEPAYCREPPDRQYSIDLSLKLKDLERSEVCEGRLPSSAVLWCSKPRHCSKLRIRLSCELRKRIEHIISLSPEDWLRMEPLGAN